MKERPILFNSPMIRAILEGRKTQTRRLVVPRHIHAARKVSAQDIADVGTFCAKDGVLRGYLRAWPGVSIGKAVCPYGVAGDRLWVREKARLRAISSEGWTSLVYGADNEQREFHLEGCAPYPLHGAWKPSIHMPRWASRLTLEVTGLRVQRLQEISEGDAQAEGVQAAQSSTGEASKFRWHRAEFAKLWDSINGHRASWSSNPWVWVVRFRRLEGFSLTPAPPSA